MSNQPFKKIPVRLGISAVIWQNARKDGKGYEYPITVERSYQDRDGNWQTTTTMFNEHSLIAAKAHTMAYDFLVTEVYPEQRQAAAAQDNTSLAPDPVPAPDENF